MSTLPSSIVRNLRETQPDKRTHTRELTALLDSSIEARPLALPGVGSFEVLDESFAYYWARRGRGDKADSTRYMQLKAAGYTNATIKDVKPLVANINADETEITCGVDLVLMKAKPEVHYGAMKFWQQRAINMTSPRTKEGRDMMMRSSEFRPADKQSLDATNTHFLNDTELEQSATPEWKNIAAKDKKGAK